MSIPSWFWILSASAIILFVIGNHFSVSVEYEEDEEDEETDEDDDEDEEDEEEEDEEEYDESVIDLDDPSVTIEGNDSSLRYNNERFSF